tara:strand:- start:298 stop:438 length:141 start_codon:yes stop_codon:yes gene_type:complete
MIDILTHIVVYFVGLATGMYAASQIENGINKNINKNNGITKNKGKG